MKKIISLVALVLFFTACQDDDIKKEKVFDTTPKENSLENEIEEVSVLIHGGHLHTERFHNDPSDKFFKKKFLVYFKKQKNGKWTQILKGNDHEIDFSKGKGIPAEGGNTPNDFRTNNGTRYAFELTFYDKDGNILNSKIQEEADYYQVFYTTDSYHDLYDKNKVTSTKNNGKDFINFRYRDIKDNKPTGLKGYMGATKFEISYDINISLFEWNSADKKGNGLEFNNLPKTGGKTIVNINIPMDVVYYRPSTDKETEVALEKFAKYFGTTVEEYKKAKENAPGGESGTYWM